MKDKIIESYREVVAQQLVIINDYKELLKMVQDDRDAKTDELNHLKDENIQLRRIVSLYDGTVERRA